MYSEAFIRGFKKRADLLGAIGEGAGLVSNASSIKNIGSGENLVEHGLSGASGATSMGGIANSALNKIAPVKPPIPILETMGRAAPPITAATMGYQAGNLLANPEQQINKVNDAMQNKGPLGRALEGASNAPGTIGAFVGGMAKNWWDSESNSFDAGMRQFNNAQAPSTPRSRGSYASPQQSLGQPISKPSPSNFNPVRK
ncbi:MAG TPA: hypothetical protein VNZ45_18965 [Bacteroidia bacterium]|jgi:hypothetical protein|nr:hypothetical protein [Bacteroidia bacterium]